MNKPKTALITGASSGIGLELARIHASRGGNLILTARRIDLLENLKKEITEKSGVNVFLIQKDLAQPGAAWEIFESLKKKGIEIDYLINNAGFGLYGKFEEQDSAELRRMIELNITALTELTHLFLPSMIKRGNGRIMNVASTAAFQAGPLLSVYSATKAYVLHFSEGVGNETSHTGVTITAFCPGATATGFQEAAHIGESRLVKGKKLPEAEPVALYGYKAMLKGKKVAIPGFMNAVMAATTGFMPRAWVTGVARMMMEKKK
jgi:short-subunit dehydrogenase